MALNYKNVPSLFTWGGLGDISEGRANLGDDMPVLVYRLFQYSMKDILKREYGAETAAELYRAAGYLAGTQFAHNVLDLSGDFDYFVTNLQKQLTELKIGILRIEKADIANSTFTLTVSEDLDCSGLPVTDETVCDYDEGFLAGILEAYTGKPFAVKEIDCWASGDRTCRFTAKGATA
ncbi:MAG: 4-vinyl reductase [Clostridiales bacterium]|jgi:predicted hydrocarbon binding protein|nr:4-vinyl reductase [Clostridiales bacterium]